MGSAEFERRLWIASAEKAVDKAGDEAVSRADAVEDVETRVVAAAVKFAVMPSESSPVIDVGGVNAAQSSGDGFEIGIFGSEGAHERTEGVRLDMEEIASIGVVWTRLGRAVGEHTDHDIDVRGEAMIERLSGREAAAFLPERRPVIEVIGDGHTVAFGGFTSLNGKLCGAL